MWNELGKSWEIIGKKSPSVGTIWEKLSNLQLHLFLYLCIQCLGNLEAFVEELAFLIAWLVGVPPVNILLGKPVYANKLAHILVLALILQSLNRQCIDALATFVQVPWEIVLAPQQHAHPPTMSDSYSKASPCR